MATYNEKMKRLEAERLAKAGAVTASRPPNRAGHGRVLTGDPRPERTVARDLVRHGLILGPVLVLVCGAVWGLERGDLRPAMPSPSCWSTSCWPRR